MSRSPHHLQHYQSNYSTSHLQRHLRLSRPSVFGEFSPPDSLQLEVSGSQYQQPLKLLQAIRLNILTTNLKHCLEYISLNCLLVLNARSKLSIQASSHFQHSTYS